MNAARGLRALCGLKAGRGEERETLRLSADSAEALLVAWLEELIFRLSARAQVCVRARWSRCEGGVLAGTVSWRRLAPDERPRLEVKAATYHRLKVVRRRGALGATVIVDV